ncbi:hypothetical protein [Nonomuraea sp. NPDC050310]|uniref:hypothetical protein n=1 Tax=Nonomuraea sp. NPDC050310 TaxID=3154935 RepID=UPI0033DE8BF5
MARSSGGRRRRAARGRWGLALSVLTAAGLAGGGYLVLGTVEQSGPAVAAAAPGRVVPVIVDETPAPAASKTPDKPARASKHTDRKAAAYFTRRWGPADKAVKRIKDVRTVGGYLRIYTDLPESANNSAPALTLCERGVDYLKEQGVADPVVFVQAEFGENGNPVLANILGPGDGNCRVTHPEPGR